MRVISWNLFHGRSHPSTGRSMRAEFFATLAAWEWDVALLQEVPPWWPSPLAQACGADYRRVLTSRNLCRPLRRALWCRFPDRIRSNQGGANAILVRGTPIAEHRRLRLRWRPERRWMHGVRLAGGAWIVNLHATVPRGDPEQHDLAKATAAALGWAGDAPLVFGGDLNQSKPRVPGLRQVAARHVDHIFVRGFEAAGPGEVLERPQRLSDHPPLAVSLRPAQGDP
jgi:endonuclease/exonuclease/phosphatase family metal-dependent hydrolase